MLNDADTTKNRTNENEKHDEPKTKKNSFHVVNPNL